MRISDWSSDVCSSDLDNEISWLRWEGLDPLDSAFAGFVAPALAIRRSYPELRQPDFLHGEPVEVAGSPNVQRLGAEGTPLQEDGGRDPIVKVIGDRMSVGLGKSVSVRVDPGGRRIIQKQNNS